MQPIHSAASSGQIDVISVLVEKYGVDPQEKADVCMCICVMYVHTYMHIYVYACIATYSSYVHAVNYYV